MKTIKILYILLLAIIGTAHAQYTKLIDFDGTKGSQPYGSLISDGTFLYGMTNQGGKAGYGVLFKIKPDGTSYDTLMSFLGVSNGAFPRGSLITDGTFLYGMTSQGGTSSRGTIFKIKPDGTGYVKLLDFLGAVNGGNPEDDLMFDGTFLYGMTGQGGTYDKGTIFKIKLDGTGFTNLYNFGDSGAYDASGANGSLISDGTFLFGVTPGGGINNTGTIFKIKPDGTGYVKFFDFSSIASGVYPESSLVSIGGSLYGVAHYGGASSGVGGVVFKIDPDGSGYVVLHDFSGTADGCSPVCSLISEGTNLYGMTSTGGTAYCSNGFGTIFKIKPDGSGFKKLFDFTGITNGKYPQGALISDGGYLYGMAQLGGANNYGSIFKFYSFAVDSIIYSPSSCYGGNDGSATAIVSGGLTPYNYLWNTTPAQTTQTATGLAAGSYTVKVTDANSHSETASVNIPQVLADAIDAGSDSTIICSDTTYLLAKPCWKEIYTDPSATILHSLCFTNADTGYAVGAFGTVLKTTNAGNTWSKKSIGPADGLLDVKFINKDTGYISGDNGRIYKTIDAGGTWTQQVSNVSTYLFSLFFTDHNTGYVVGGMSSTSCTILKTVNGGNTWVAQSGGTTQSLRSVFFTSPSIGYAAGYNGTILKTTNSGTNWSTLTSGTLEILNSIYFINPDTGFACGQNVLLRTYDAGASWNPVTLGFNASLESIFAYNPDTIFISGGNGIIIRSYDGGQSWSRDCCNASQQLASVFFTSSSTGYTLGGPVILKYAEPEYEWSPSGSLSSFDIPNPQAFPITTTNYTVTITTEAGCTATDQVTVYVNPFIIDAGSDLTIICGGSVPLNNVSSNYPGTGDLTYRWSPSAGLNYDTIPNPTATVAVNTKFYVTVTTPNGCEAIDSVMVFVNPLTAEAGTDKTIICGGSAQFDNVSSNYTGNDTLMYQWSPSSGLNFDTVPNPTATVTNNTVFYVTVTTPNGCEVIDSISVIVNPLTITGTDANIFCGDSTTLNTTINYTGTGTLTYEWAPSFGLSDTTISNPVAETDSNQTYSVTVTTPNGCIATDDVNIFITSMNAPEICIVSVDSTNKNLVVWDKPLSSAIDTFYIFKETTTNNYQKIGAVPYDSLSVFVDSTSQPDVQSNKYKISIFDRCGLESEKSAYHKTMHLAINQGVGDTWNLIWESYEGFTVTSYNIYRGTSPDTLFQIGNTSGGSTQYTDLAPPAGYVYYQVEVVSPNSCNPTKSFNSSRSNIASNHPDGVYENNNAADLFSIYPNPINKSFIINISKTPEQNFSLELYSVDGQLKKSFTINQQKTEVDISDLVPGIYMIKLTGQKNSSMKMLIKE